MSSTNTTGGTPIDPTGSPTVAPPISTAVPTSEAPVVTPSSPPPAETSSAPPVETSSAPPPAETSSSQPQVNPPTETSSAPPDTTSNSGGTNNGGSEGSNSSGSPQQTSSAGGNNNNNGGSDTGTSNGGTNNTNGGGSSATPTNGPSGAVSTDANGQTVIVVTTVFTSNGVAITSTAESSLPAKKSSSNTGAIVGGTVGGVVGLAAILIFLYLLLRKRKRSYRDDFDDMMFDPARAQNHGPIDLSDDQGAPTVDPYEYKPVVPGIASTVVPHQQQEMAQAYPYPGGDGVSRAPTSSAGTSAGYAGYGAGGVATYGAPVTAFPQPQTGSSTPLSPVSGGSQPGAMSAKQLEAYQEAQRFRVQNPGAGPSSGLTVHEDGGAYTEAGPSDGNEIPPTYDSIRR